MNFTIFATISKENNLGHVISEEEIKIDYFLARDTDPEIIDIRTQGYNYVTHKTYWRECSPSERGDFDFWVDCNWQMLVERMYEEAFEAEGYLEPEYEGTLP